MPWRKVDWDAEVTYVDSLGRRMTLKRSFTTFTLAHEWVTEVWYDCFVRECTEVTGKIAEMTAEGAEG